MSISLAELSQEDRLLLEEQAALIMADVRRRQGWKETPIGREIAEYLTWKELEWGAAAETIANREAPLYKLAEDHLHQPFSIFEPPGGTQRVRDTLYKNWGEASDGTFANRVSIYRDFFAWAHREDKLEADPMFKITRPRKRRKSARVAHERKQLVTLIQAQKLTRDRIALELLARHGLRKNELRLLQLLHFNPAESSLILFGKGAKPATIPLAPDLSERFERYMLDRDRREFLLYPQRIGRRGSYPLYSQEVIWEDRFRPKSSRAMQEWWRDCLKRAGIEPFPMHELRHSAGTAFHLEHGDYELTRQFLRHENIATTAEYIHVPNVHVARAIRAMPDFWRDE